MKIDSTIFGAITIDGKTYQHDVVVRLSGEVVKRKKKLSKKLYGTSHVLSKDEAKFLFEKGCDQVVIGSGQMGNVHLSPEAEAYFERKGCEVVLKPTPEAIRMFNRSRIKRIGLFSRDLLKMPGWRWISRIGAPLSAFVLTVAPSVSTVHAFGGCSQGERGVLRPFRRSRRV